MMIVRLFGHPLVRDSLTGVPTIPCSIKRNYVRTALCDLGAGVSVMPLSLYHRLDLNKLTPTEISLQMADKSTAIPVGIC